MPEKRNDDSLITRFFKEDAPEITQLFGQEDGTLTSSGTHGPANPKPELVTPDPAASEKEMAHLWKSLRSFFRSGAGPGLPRFDGATMLKPLLLYRIEDGFIPEGYPFWVDDIWDRGRFDPDKPICQSLPALFEGLLEDAPAGLDKNHLRVFLRRLLSYFHKVLRQAGEPKRFQEVLENALLDYGQHNGHTNSETTDPVVAFAKDNLPVSGLVTAFSRDLPWYLFSWAFRANRAPLLDNLREEIRVLIPRLSGILKVEDEKRPKATDPSTLHDMLSFADAHIRFDTLSAVSPQPGSEKMPDTEYLRIQKTISVLKVAESILRETDAQLLISRALSPERDNIWEQIFFKTDLHFESEPGLVASAIKTFDRKMLELTPVFAALRIARLELNGQYQPEVHDLFFDAFDWRHLTDEELALCPPVIIMTPDSALSGQAMASYSQLFSSNRPIQVFAIHSGRTEKTSGEEVLFQREPAMFAMTHRHTHAFQSTAADAMVVFQGFVEGLSSGIPGLFRILIPPEDLPERTDPFLWLSAAITGRFFPQFSYNNRKSQRWGERLDITMNPQPDALWPEHEITISENREDKRATYAFTFADFAVLDPDYTHDFFLIPDNLQSEYLIPLDHYLSLQQEEMYGRIPYLWLISASNQMVRAAVSWRIVLRCKERLDFWDFLQENAGTRNIHVEQAVEKARNAMVKGHTAELERLKSANAEAIQEARESATAQAMHRLANALLELGDADAIQKIVLPDKQTKPAETHPKQAAEEADIRKKEPKKAAETESAHALPDQAWIETELCTSCNDCININKNIFRYNDDKQAYIADPKGGPYRDIVKAAEKCPAAIIHPGLPQDPDEKNLEALIRRAEKFN